MAGDRPRQPAYEIFSIKCRFQQFKSGCSRFKEACAHECQRGVPLLKMIIYPLLACLTWKWLEIGTDMLLNITSNSDELLRNINIDDVDWPWTLKIGICGDFLSDFWLQRSELRWNGWRQTKITCEHKLLKVLAHLMGISSDFLFSYMRGFKPHIHPLSLKYIIIFEKYDAKNLLLSPMAIAGSFSRGHFLISTPHGSSHVPWFLSKASAVKSGILSISEVSTSSWSLASCKSCAPSPQYACHAPAS